MLRKQRGSASGVPEYDAASLRDLSTLYVCDQCGQCLSGVDRINEKPLTLCQIFDCLGGFFSRHFVTRLIKFSLTLYIRSRIDGYIGHTEIFERLIGEICRFFQIGIILFADIDGNDSGIAADQLPSCGKSGHCSGSSGRVIEEIGFLSKSLHLLCKLQITVSKSD